MKKLVALSLCVYVVFASSAYAMTVSDPGAYGYFGKQIEQMVQQIKELQMLKEGTFGRLEEINKQVSGQFGGLKQVYDQLNTAKNDIQGIYGSVGSIKPPTTLQEAARKWSTLKDLSKGSAGSGKVLDETFKDPRAGGKDDIKYINRQYDMRQNALKAAIQKAEELLQDVPSRLDNVGKLIEAASAAKSQAEKQDVTNALLVEILRTLTIYQSTLIQFEQAKALMAYTGVDSKAMEQRESILWPIKKAVDASAGAQPAGAGDNFGDLHEGAIKRGVDTSNPESLKGRDIGADIAKSIKL